MNPSEWETEIGGTFRIHRAVTRAMPVGTRILSAEPCGVSAWTKTAKIDVILSDQSSKSYFLKCATGEGSQALVEGEYESACAINKIVPGLVPRATGWGKYLDGSTQVYFFLGNHHDMDLVPAPEPASLVERVAKMHIEGKSPTGMFGFHVPTVCGKFVRTTKWEKTWAACFTNLLNDVIRYDNETNGPWPEFDAACKQVIDVVIPRLLGALQSDGRNIEPVLIHGDLWEQNVGIDMETGDTILFDPGSVYAHNEMEFGTWRASWACHFNSPIYMRLYQRHIEPSEPVDEWDDRNRLYSVHIYLNDSAGHPGSISRATAYNDMLYLCEKYAPLEGLGTYRPENDVSVTGAYIEHETTKTSHLHNAVKA